MPENLGQALSDAAYVLEHPETVAHHSNVNAALHLFIGIARLYQSQGGDIAKAMAPAYISEAKEILG